MGIKGEGIQEREKWGAVNIYNVQSFILSLNTIIQTMRPVECGHYSIFEFIDMNITVGGGGGGRTVKWGYSSSILDPAQSATLNIA